MSRIADSLVATWEAQCVAQALARNAAEIAVQNGRLFTLNASCTVTSQKTGGVACGVLRGEYTGDSGTCNPGLVCQRSTNVQKALLIATVLAFGLGAFEFRVGLAIAKCLMMTEAPGASKNQVVAFLNRVGLSADSLVVAGMSASDLPSIVAAATAQLTSHDAELRASDEQCLSLRRRKAELQSQVNRNDGSVTPESVTSAQSQLDGALVQRDLLLSQMATETIAALPQDVRELLGTVVRNSRFGVPAQYCVVDRTDSEWAALKSALAGVASASRRQVSASVQDVSLISAANAMAATVQANQRLAEGLVAMKTAWATAFANE